MNYCTTFTIALGPFALFLLSSAYGEVASSTRWQTYSIHLEQAWEEATVLDQKLRNLQRSYTLLHAGEEKIITHSLLKEYLRETFDSSFEGYAALQQSLRNTQDAVEILQARFNTIGHKAMHVDLSKQELALIDDGTIVTRYPVSSGAWETPTPTGEFQIHQKQTLRISNLETPYRMPYYMAFTPNASHGLHALPYLGESPEDSDYWHEARSHIGIPASHGCIRLLPEDAEHVYEWVEVGTKVIINT